MLWGTFSSPATAAEALDDCRLGGGGGGARFLGGGGACSCHAPVLGLQYIPEALRQRVPHQRRILCLDLVPRSTHHRIVHAGT